MAAFLWAGSRVSTARTESVAIATASTRAGSIKAKVFNHKLPDWAWGSSQQALRVESINPLGTTAVLTVCVRSRR